jgi:hypothetical protein
VDIKIDTEEYPVQCTLTMFRKWNSFEQTRCITVSHYSLHFLSYLRCCVLFISTGIRILIHMHILMIFVLTVLPLNVNVTQSVTSS